MKDRDVDVLVTVFPPPLILAEKSVAKLRASEAAMRKITYMRNETKSISVLVKQFLVNSLFYT